MKQYTKIFFFFLILFFFSSITYAIEWLACDVPDAVQDVVSVFVIVDNQLEVIVPLRLNQAQDAVLIWDIIDLTAASFSVGFINFQGRRSDLVPFDLSAKPLPLSGYRIIVE